MLTTIRKAAAIVLCSITLVIGSSLPAATQNRSADFSFRAIDGEAVTTESTRGEVTVLVFGASWLPLTRTQMEAVKKLGDQYAGRGVAVYWVSTESANTKSKNFVSDEQLRDLGRKYKVTVLRDPDGVSSKKLGVDQVPSVVIIGKQGNIAETIGGMDPSANLAAQLSERLSRVL